MSRHSKQKTNVPAGNNTANGAKQIVNQSATSGYTIGKSPIDKLPPDSLGNVLTLNTDPLDEYAAQKGYLCKREYLWHITSRSPALMRIAQNAAFSIGAMDVLIRPTKSVLTDSEYSQLLVAANAINRSARMAGEMASLAKAFVDGWLRSHTGAVCVPSILPNGDISSFQFINPVSVMPHYGFDSSGNLLPFPTINNNEAKGIWYFAPGYILPFATSNYYQAVHGSYGSGEWLIGDPPAHEIISDVVMDLMLADIERRTVGGTDLSQIVTISNASRKELEDWRDKVDAWRKQRVIDANGMPVPYSTRPQRLTLYSEAAASISEDVRVGVFDLRLLPKDFDLNKSRNTAAINVARGLGVSIRWAGEQISQTHSGNATEKALRDSDSPGMDAMQKSFTSMLQRMLLPDKPAYVKLVSKSVPESYARLEADKTAAQVAQALLALGVDKETYLQYLVEMGVLMPSAIGAVSVSAEEGDGNTLQKTVASAQRHIPNGGVAMLVDAGNGVMPYIHKRPIAIATKASGYEQCALQAMAAFDEWMNNQLPTMFDGNALDLVEASDDIDWITQTIAGQLVMCAKKQAGGVKNGRITNYLDLLKFSLFNRWGSPQINHRRTHPPTPSENMYKRVASLAGAISRGQATEEDVKNAILHFRHDITRYFQATSTVGFIADAIKGGGDIEWKLNDVGVHCSECPDYAGRYGSLAEMLIKTSGKFPRDIRLKCSGNCQCELLVHRN